MSKKKSKSHGGASEVVREGTGDQTGWLVIETSPLPPTREEAIDLVAPIMQERGSEWLDQTKVRVAPMIDALIALGILEVRQ
jgi:hypothetical protein